MKVVHCACAPKHTALQICSTSWDSNELKVLLLLLIPHLDADSSPTTKSIKVNEKCNYFFERDKKYKAFILKPFYKYLP